MNKIIKLSVVKSARIYTLSSIINAGIPFLLMPLLTRYLNPVDYGITAMLQVLVGVITPFVGLNVHGAIAVKYFKKDSVNFPQYVSSCLLILIVTSIFMSGVFFVFNNQIENEFGIPGTWLWSVLLICFGQFVISIILTIMQSSDQPKMYGSIQVLQTIMNVSITIWLVVVMNFNWQGRIIAQAITVVCFALASIVMLYYRHWLIWDYDMGYIIDALKFGAPLIPHALSGFVMNMADRIIITKLVGLADTGIYTVGAQIGMVIGLLATSINNAFAPWLYKKLNENTAAMKVKIVKITYTYMVSIIVFSVAFSLIMPWLLKYFVGREFYAASSIIVWISLGYAFNGMYMMVVNYIFYVEKTYILAGITFFSAMLHILFTYYAVSFWGTIGAGYANTISYFVFFMITWLFSAKVYSMPWRDVFINILCRMRFRRE